MPTNSASLALQKAIKSAVGAATGSTPVYDYVPETAALPYLTIGIDECREWGTKTWVGQDIVAIVNTWSDYYGRKEAKEILDAAQQALTSDTELDLTADGFTVILQQFMESTVQIEEYSPGSGKLVYHGTLRMHYLIQQT